MSTEATIEMSDVLPAAESARVATAFEDRLKAAAPEAEPEKTDEVVTKIEPAKTEAKVPDGAEDEFPAHVITGEKPVEEAPKDTELEGILPPPKMSQTAAKHWATLKETAEKRLFLVQSLTKELEEAKKVKPAEADPQAQEQVKAALERAAALEAELEKASFERSPKYKALVEEAGGAIATAKSYLEGTEADPSIIDRAAGLTGAKRLAVLRDAELDGATVAAISAALADLDKTNAKRDGMMAQHKTVQADWEAQQKAIADANEKRLQAREEQIFGSVLERVKATFPTYQTVNGNEQWNAQIAATIERAKGYALGTNNDAEGLFELALAGAAYPIEHRRANILAQKLKAAQTELAALKVAQPGAGETNGGKAPVAAGASLDGSPDAVANRFNQRMGVG